MARGDRREPIVQDDEDRTTFVRTLGEASERAGFRVQFVDISWIFLVAPIQSLRRCITSLVRRIVRQQEDLSPMLSFWLIQSKRTVVSFWINEATSPFLQSALAALRSSSRLTPKCSRPA